MLCNEKFKLDRYDDIRELDDILASEGQDQIVAQFFQGNPDLLIEASYYVNLHSVEDPSVFRKMREQQQPLNKKRRGLSASRQTKLKPQPRLQASSSTTSPKNLLSQMNLQPRPSIFNCQKQIQDFERYSHASLNLIKRNHQLSQFNVDGKIGVSEAAR